MKLPNLASVIRPFSDTKNEFIYPEDMLKVGCTINEVLH